jgi:hypothetical protein
LLSKYAIDIRYMAVLVWSQAGCLCLRVFRLRQYDNDILVRFAQVSPARNWLTLIWESRT